MYVRNLLNMRQKAVNDTLWLQTQTTNFVLFMLCFFSYLQESLSHLLDGLSNLLWVCLSCCELCPIFPDLKLPFVQPNMFCPNPPGPTGPISWSPALHLTTQTPFSLTWVLQNRLAFCHHRNIGSAPPTKSYLTTVSLAAGSYDCLRQSRVFCYWNPPSILDSKALCKQL